MTDQRIIKERRPALFTLADGSEVKGEVFLNLYEARRMGPQRVGELLNGEEAFLPVATAEGMVHLNVSNIVTACTETHSEWDDLETLGRKYAVRIRTHLGEISGDVFVNLPREHSRVSDFLNQPGRFLRISGPEETVYVASRYILSVRDEQTDP
jgi:hypothetical protein